MFKFICVILSAFAALMILSFGTKYTILQEPWRVPASADSLYNPYHIEPLTLPQGQEIYLIYCAPCHGSQGKADGQIASKLKVKPLHFQSKMFGAQTNGAIFWKIREGRGEMPSFKEILSDEQKWQLVEYLRDISKPFDQQLNPFKIRN